MVHLAYTAVRETPRGRLRAPSQADYPAIVSACKTPGFNAGMTWDPPQSEADLAEALGRAIDDWQAGRRFTWTMEDRTSADVIGRFDIRIEDAATAEWSIGYWVHPAYQERGFATEGATELIRLGFGTLGARTISASHAQWNRASARVLTKLGLARVNTTDQGFEKNGRWVPEFQYALARADFETGDLCPDRLFVYGSLQPGRSNADVLTDVGGTWQVGGVRGTLFEAGWGSNEGFPGIVIHANGAEVKGALLSSPALPLHWQRLDEFEGDDYQRVLAPVTLESGATVRAFVYAVEPPEVGG
ncbi:MAG: GNAT family N-acetyltransferase [Pseudomonadota bacterium]